MTDSERIAALEVEVAQLKEALRLIGVIFEKTAHNHPYQGNWDAGYQSELYVDKTEEEKEEGLPELLGLAQAVSRLGKD